MSGKLRGGGGSKHALVDLTFGLEIGPEFEDSVSQTRRNNFLSTYHPCPVESDATLELRPNIHTLDVNFSVNSLGPTFCP